MVKKFAVLLHLVSQHYCTCAQVVACYLYMYSLQAVQPAVYTMLADNAKHGDTYTSI
jgi:hypothetical protein